MASRVDVQTLQALQFMLTFFDNDGHACLKVRLKPSNHERNCHTIFLYYISYYFEVDQPRQGLGLH